MSLLKPELLGAGVKVIALVLPLPCVGGIFYCCTTTILMCLMNALPR